MSLDFETIHAYNTHTNIPWNIIEYQPTPDDSKAYFSNKKKSSLTPHVTKKGFFLDQHIKNVKGLPAPCHYPANSDFDQTLNKKLSLKIKINPRLIKNTYIQQIQKKAKRHKSPGVGEYHLESPASSPTKKLRKASDPRKFYNDTQFLSNAIPGAGNYCPHDQLDKTKTDRTTYKLWIQKHNKINKKDAKRRLKQPDPGSYRPVSASFNSFDRMGLQHQKRMKLHGKNRTPSHGFCSSDSKFEYTRKKKGKAEVRPDPCGYNTAILWNGKGGDVKARSWVRCLSAGPTRGVYH